MISFNLCLFNHLKRKLVRFTYIIIHYNAYMSLFLLITRLTFSNESYIWNYFSKKSSFIHIIDILRFIFVDEICNGPLDCPITATPKRLCVMIRLPDHNVPTAY